MVCTQKKRMLLFQIQGDFLKIAKLIPSKKTSFSKSQKLVPTKHKKSPIRKIKRPKKSSAKR